MISRFLIVAATMSFLASCSTPATRTETVEVKVPVAVQPIKPTDVPTPVAPLGPKPRLANGKTDVARAGDMLMSKWCAAVAYMLKADPLLRVSAGMQQSALARYPECGDR